MITITSANTKDLLVYIKGEKPMLHTYDFVRFKHDKKTKGKEIITTFGRVLFNSFLPEDYEFIDEPVNRSKLREILFDILQKYGKETYEKVVHNIQRYGLLLSGFAPATIELSKLELPEEIKKLKEELIQKADKLDPVEFDKEIEKIYEKLEKYLKDASFFDMVKSGTKGKKSDLQQLFIAWGPPFDPLNEEVSKLIVKNSLLEGLTPQEMYYGANKSRYAAYAASHYSSYPGYLARKLRLALNALKISNIEDCKTKKYFRLKLDEKLAKIVIGRYYYDDKKMKLVKITNDNVKSLIGKVINLRSPLYCKAPKNEICRICYGDMHNKLKNEYIGLTASGAIYVYSLNQFAQKVKHHKLSSQEEVDFEKELEKFYG